MTEDAKKAIITMYCCGFGVSRIARITGISAECLRRNISDVKDALDRGKFYIEDLCEQITFVDEEGI